VTVLSLSDTLEQLERIESELLAIRELLGTPDEPSLAALEWHTRDLAREAERLARCARAREGMLLG